MPTPISALLPNGKQQFFDRNGDTVALGTVGFFIPGTDTPKDTWSDPDESVLNTNPVALDAGGMALIYGSGQYRQVVQNSSGDIIWDELTYGLAPPAEEVATVGFGAKTNIAGAGSVDLGSITTHFANVTGIGWTLTSFGSSADTDLPVYLVMFAGVGTITDSVNLVCPDGDNITTSAGDSAWVYYQGSGVWTIFDYMPANPGGGSQSGYNYDLITAAGTWTVPSDATVDTVFRWRGVAPGGGGGGVATNNDAAAGGGGAGGSMDVLLKGFTAGEDVTFVFGTPGTAGANTGTNGGSATSSTLTYNSIVVATLTGGQGGQGSTSATLPKDGGAQGACLLTLGASGLILVIQTVLPTSTAGGDSTAAVQSGYGGSSIFGAGGAEGTSGSPSVGQQGTGYGSGASGAGPRAGANLAGAAGTAGAFLIEWWA